MTTSRSWGWPARRWGASLIMVLLVAGCAAKKVDWSSRVGAYTYDQAVTELGPPDKSARLSTGATVAEWMTRRGSPGGWGGVGYYPPPYYGPYRYYRGAYATFYNPPTPDYFLRLTFDPDGRLSAWRRLSR